LNSSQEATDNRPELSHGMSDVYVHEGTSIRTSENSNSIDNAIMTFHYNPSKRETREVIDSHSNVELDLKVVTRPNTMAVMSTNTLQVTKITIFKME